MLTMLLYDAKPSMWIIDPGAILFWMISSNVAEVLS